MHWRRPTQSGTACFPTVHCIMQPKQTWCRHRIMKVRPSFAWAGVCPAWCCGCALNALQKAGESSGQQLLSHGNQGCTANSIRDRHGELLPRATNAPFSTSQSLAWLSRHCRHTQQESRPNQAGTSSDHSWAGIMRVCDCQNNEWGLDRGWRSAAFLVRTHSGLEAPGQQLVSVPSWDRRKDVSLPCSSTCSC